MKIREKLVKSLHDRGLFETEAKGVIKLYEDSPLGEAMKGRMDDDESDYPPQIFIGTWMGVCKIAVQWIDENKPEHWARPLFAN